MRVLVDTHVLLWWWSDDDRLPGATTDLLDDPNTDRVISVISPWEIALKVGIGKLDVDLDELPPLLDASAATVLPVTLDHVLGTSALPLHHRDPFDRLLISQARTDGLTILTADDTFESYDVPVLRAR